jgi:hypothetical protein
VGYLRTRERGLSSDPLLLWLYQARERAPIPRTYERGRIMHTHKFIATDIPGVSLCKCGVEIYYASKEQAYYVSVEGE